MIVRLGNVDNITEILIQVRNDKAFTHVRSQICGSFLFHLT